MDSEQPSWDKVHPGLHRSLEAAWESGFPIPIEASALYGRWWQLETWLRSLCYVELRCRYGDRWVERIPTKVDDRGDRDRRYRHMMSPDALDRLAYLDTSGLAKVIENDWDLFEGSLLPKGVWQGRLEEVLNIRNRIGHCRRPHEYDLTRVELFLGDLEPGLRKAVTAFHDRDVPDRRLRDYVVASWIRRDHEGARRLLDHVERSYDVHLRLSFSKRPWADTPAEGKAITGQSGYVWHVTWLLRDDPADLARFWHYDRLDDMRDTVLLVCADYPGAIEVSFPALEGGEAIADGIETLFDSLLETRWRGPLDHDFHRQWKTAGKMLDPRVQVESPWGDAGPVMEGSPFGV